MAPRADGLAALLATRIQEAPAGAADRILFPGKAPVLAYAANTTTTSKFAVPPGTLGMVLITSSGFTSFTLKGRTTKFSYLSLGAATSSQYLQSAWAFSPDDEGEITIVTGAGQAGSIFAVAFFNPIPPSPLTLVRQNAFPSAARAVGTYTFNVPAQSFGKGIIVYTAVTASSGAGTVVTTVQSSDTALTGGVIDNLLASTAKGVGSGSNLYVYVGAQSVANVSINAVIGQTPTIQAVVAVASTTFQVDYDLIP